MVSSPLAAQISLSTALQGAKGTTATEIITSLNFTGITSEEIATNFQTLLQSIQSETSPLQIAHKLFAAVPLVIDPAYNNNLATRFLTSAASINFADAPQAATTINTWVATKTRNAIQSVITATDVNSTTSILLPSAIYFKGIWKEEFNKRKTFESGFHINADDSVNIDFMRSTV